MGTHRGGVSRYNLGSVHDLEGSFSMTEGLKWTKSPHQVFRTHRPEMSDIPKTSDNATLGWMRTITMTLLSRLIFPRGPGLRKESKMCCITTKEWKVEEFKFGCLDETWKQSCSLNPILGHSSFVIRGIWTEVIFRVTSLLGRKSHTRDFHSCFPADMWNTHRYNF